MHSPELGSGNLYLLPSVFACSKSHDDEREHDNYFAREVYAAPERQAVIVVDPENARCDAKAQV
jgi:hypothetical protein